FHTPHMAPARERLAKALAGVDLRSPDVPVLANVDARPHEDPDEWSTLLDEQLTSPVRWRQVLYELQDAGVSTFVELGPGGVLSGLAKRTVKGALVLSVAGPDDLEAVVDALTHPAGAGRGDEGEGLFIRERLVVSPVTGLFTPTPGLAPGAVLAAGDLVGEVAGTEVRTPFAGTL